MDGGFRGMMMMLFPWLKSRFSLHCTKADFGCTSTAVVGVHAELDSTVGCLIRQAEGLLAPRAADDVEGHWG